MRSEHKSLVWFLFVTLLVTLGVGFYYKQDLRALQRHHQYCDLTSEKPVVVLLEEAKAQVSYLTREYNNEKELNTDLKQRLDATTTDPDYYKKPGCHWLETTVRDRPTSEGSQFYNSRPVVFVREGPERYVAEFRTNDEAYAYIRRHELHECKP